MSIFQKSVLNKHLKNLDTPLVDEAFRKFKKNFSPAKIERIKALKEEEYQDGFLRDLFVDILGYTLSPDDNYNLVREFKNQDDSKKADGAILKDGKAVAVIELKSTKTKDLKSVTEQAFNYKNNQPECSYVITSNFRKLRFYVDYANEFEEFDLFYLQKEEFYLLYLLLHADSVLSGLPRKLKEETKFHEQEISGKFYNDYSAFKNKLFGNLLQNNPEIDRLTLFKKSQKLLDRFLFILFAEDSGLLPPNSVSRIIETYYKLKELDAFKPIYDIYKQYFGYMNTGRKGKTTMDDIPAYNGGLFYPDALLDSLIIDDDILIADLLKLSEYDFNTEVDVNILGHIFEHSLSEMEEIVAGLGGAAAGKSKGKRKKDGIFYTPKYITQYIIQNTIGILCSEKRKELGIEEIEFDGTYRTKNGKLSARGKRLFRQLNDYKTWLFSLKIVDPACGSGAFLNQALNFLIQEHKEVDDIIAELTNSALRLFDTEKSILENNLFGVDINQESVEIAKLSLWLRTAHKGRKLSNLNNNIKCGNSLIDDPAVAGDKAFDWHKQFPQVFREKKKKPWHITTATHNSRYSQRMFDYHVKTGDAVWLEEEEEVVVATAIRDIAKEDNLNVLAFQVCGDHIHLLLVCEEEELSNIVRKIKGKSSQKLKEFLRIPREDKFALWTQKFGKKEIKSDRQLWNTVEYIRKNRLKHGMPGNNGLQPVVDDPVLNRPYEYAVRTEYTGGFDAVIGNPPYGAKIAKKELDYLTDKQKESGLSRLLSDTYIAFYIHSLNNLLKKNGLLGFITPNTWRLIQSGREFRNFISKGNFAFQEIIQHTEKVFSDATVDCDTVIVKKEKQDDHKIRITVKNYQENIVSHSLPQAILSNQAFFNLFLTEKVYSLKEKIEKNSVRVKDFFVIKNGVKPYEKGKGKPPQTAEIVKEKPYTATSKMDESFSPLIGGSSFHRFKLMWNNDYWIKYGEWLAAPRDKSIFEAPEKLIFRQTSDSIIGTYIGPNFIVRNNTHIILPAQADISLKYLLAVLNSKLSNFYYWTINPEKGEALAEVKAFHLGLLCFPKINKGLQQPFIEKTQRLLLANKEIQGKKNKFLRRVKDNLGIGKVTQKLRNFFLYDFKTFVGELKKQGVKLTLNQQDEWEGYFYGYKKEINSLLDQVNATDREIDQMVYRLYGLTEDEIEMIEKKC